MDNLKKDLEKRKYKGQGNDCQYNLITDPETDKIHEDVPTIKEPYIASTSLAEAVNDALYLRRPLLIEGEPGCGKTRLAHSVAYELGYPLKECYIRSTSRAQDLLYTYDAVRRLYDLQEKNLIIRNETDTENKDEIESSENKEQNETTNKSISRRQYVELGKLGEAIELSQKDIPSVVLIDEIDKADIDFPNDLLLVLDKLQFEVDEVKGWKFDALQGQTPEQRRDFLPLIIITSNREKELPKAFLRRCLFYYIEFPEDEELEAIIKSHFQKDITPLFEQALIKFLQLRNQTKLAWRKKPSTSEFINWLRLLERDEEAKKITAQGLGDRALSQLPCLHTLVKNQSDRSALKKEEV